MGKGIPREWDAKVIWERKFKREVFKRIVQTLNRIGWTVGEQSHIFTDNNSRHCVKGGLQTDLKISRRSIELEFFQSVNTPDRADHSGRYQSDKEKHMPYLAWNCSGHASEFVTTFATSSPATRSRRQVGNVA